MNLKISGRTLVAGVVGSPIHHSLSPLIHNAWIQHTNLDAVYVAFSPTGENFEMFARSLRSGAIRGLNVTAPFKEIALSLADDATEFATRAGSANLLVFGSDGRILADNTDGRGLLYAFHNQVVAFEPRGKVVVVCGAGGAARGAAAAFLEAGASRIILMNRDTGRARGLAAIFGEAVTACDPDDAGVALKDADIVVNATPVNTFGPYLTSLRSEAIVMDMVYRPLRTPLLAQAAGLGLRTVDGLDMLIGQAIPSFERLFRCEAPPFDVRALAISTMEGAH